MPDINAFQCNCRAKAALDPADGADVWPADRHTPAHRLLCHPNALSSHSDQEKLLLPWTSDLLSINTRVDRLAGVDFNAVLLNYYRDGNDSVAWHTDNDGIPGRNRIVASVSFGQVRRFDVRRTSDHEEKFSVVLASGSYLLMHGDFQDQWEHRIAKSGKSLKARINLTFRIR